jgi:signal transduction histidine kinase
VAAAIVTTAVEAGAVARGYQGDALGVLAYLLLILAAVLLTRDPEQHGNALLLEVGAVAAALGDAEKPLGDWGEQLAFTTQYWAIVPITWFFFRYPDRAIRTQWHRWLLGWISLFAVGAWAVNSFLWDPVRGGEPEPNAWVTIGDWEPFRDQMQLWTVWALSLGVLAGAGALGQRWRAARGLDRTAVRPIAAVGAVLAVVVAVTTWTEWVLVRYVAVQLPDLGSVRKTVLGLATLAVLIEALRRRSASLAVVDRLLGAGPDRTRMLDVLRRAFADPALSVVEGARPQPAADRIVLPLTGRGGEQVGWVDTDPSAQRDPAWTRTVLSAAGIVVENVRLHQSVAQSLADVRSSRARLVEAGLDERRRVERDLHDGAQQQLLAVASSLGRIELVDDELARKQAIDDAKGQLETALAELRRLARGIYPPVLTQAGLGAALRTLPDTTTVPVEVALAPAARRRFRPAVESTAWFVACEAVTNAARHSGATRISVAVDADDDALEISVRDDGRGGARIASGGGLAGLADRVHALGGELTVRSEPGSGTAVTAIVPVS